jgi:8-oxo-dGTP pyrophosphatase MutT (NUDIX family)
VAEPAALIDAEQVRRRFPAGRTGAPSPVEPEGVPASAVLVPLFDGPGGMQVVLTRRAWGLRTHRGEVSFPGGRCDPGESFAEAALREAWEEIALDPSSVELLGELDHLTTVTRRAYIVPVLGLLPGRPELRPNPGEVDEALLVPLAELLHPEVFREERWGSEELHRPVYFFELVGDTVWGATAAMLRQLLAVLTDTDPGSAEDRDPAGGLHGGYRLDYPDPDSVV